MTKTDPQSSSFEDLWKTIADASHIDLQEQRMDKTIRADFNTPLDAYTQDFLPDISCSNEESPSSGEFVLKQLLGEGGMGQVFLANQKPLARDVVLKTIHPKKLNERSSTRLFQEARITGLLEHPSIVPVYQLGQNEKHEPVLVMRRIDGLTWDQIIHEKVDPSEFPEGVENSLDWHLEILVQVCKAIEFAHDKGIIHRDVKPANIMIGAYGEVYVMDWGIALSVEEAKQEYIPNFREVKGVTGTPAYMAPEMVSEDGLGLSKATDLYLLGGVLHELITKNPPHVGKTFFDTLLEAYRSAPQKYPRFVPRELSKLTQKAMAPKPEDRYKSVKEFRCALQDYLKHRESHALSSEAVLRLDLLKNLLSAMDEAKNTSIRKEKEAASQRELFDLFGQCRFGFQQALRIWSENEEAKHGLQRLVRLTASYELKYGSPRSAILIIEEIPSPEPRLQKILQKARAKIAEEAQELEKLKQLEYESSLEVSSRSRGLLTLAMALIWSFIPIFYFMSERYGFHQPSYTEQMLIGSLFGIFLLVVGFLGRNIFWRNRANRQIMWLMVLLFICLQIWRYMGHQYELSSFVFNQNKMIFLFGFTAIAAVFFMLRILFASAVYLAGITFTFFYPSYALLMLGVTNFFALVILAYCWNPDLLRLRPLQSS